ncbi:MAG: mechanosensitive ion channel family protein [Opitutales bacterium]
MALLSREELVTRFLSNASFIARNAFVYGVQIGMWVSAAFLVQRIITVFLWDGIIASISGRPVPRLPKDVTAILVFFLGAIGVLATVFDQSVTGIWATSGILSVIIGFALRNVILDVFIGLAMHVERSFQIGDWVMLHQNRVETHIIGEIIEINWRTTRLRTTSNNMVVVPNSRLGETILTNYMQPKPHFRIDLYFVIDYSIPPNRAIRILTAGVKALADGERILENPEPEVRLEEATLNGQQYEVRFFILPVNISPNESKHLVNKSILEHLVRAGVTPSAMQEEVFLSRHSNRRQLHLEDDDDLREILAGSQLVTDLSDDEKENLFQAMQPLELTAGEVLFRQGTLGDSMYLLAEGLLTSYVKMPGQEDEAKVEQIESGRHFGEDSLLTRKNRSSTVTAVTESIVFEIPRQVVLELARSSGDFLAMLNRNVALSTERIHRSKMAATQRRENAVSSKKKKASGVTKAIQTFFTDLFPGNETEAQSGQAQQESS